MINELLLFSDNLSIATKLKGLLNNYANLPSIEFRLIEEISNLEVKSNQALVILSEPDQNDFIFFERQANENTVFICAKPTPHFLEKSKNYKLIGLQRHLYKNEDDVFNLGAIRSNIAICEPIIRESTSTFIDLNVVRKSELGNAEFGFPSGLFTEDISQLCRYAGMSESVNTLYIHNVITELHDLVAQMIWYFAEAAALRFPDHPYFTNTVEAYAVEVSSFDTVLTFYKSKSSGRWWVKIPDIKENKWKSCSYEDYQLACNDNISAELLEIISVAE